MSDVERMRQALADIRDWRLFDRHDVQKAIAQARSLANYALAIPPEAAATPQGGTLTVAEPEARHDLSPAVSVFPPNGGV